MTAMKHMSLMGITSTAGGVTISGERSVLGRLYEVKWIDGTLADGVGAVLSAVGGVVDTTLLTLTAANSDAVYRPRALVHDATGTALTGTAGGDREMPVIDGVPTLTISSGGSQVSGGCIIYYFDN